MTRDEAIGLHAAMTGLLCTTEPTNVDYLARVLSIAALVVIPAFAALVAWRQLVVARKKLRLDLSDSTRSRRCREIYEATSKFVHSINNDPEQVHIYLNEFNAGTSDAELLFNSKVVDYIQEIRSHAAAMETAHKLSDERQRDEKTRVRNIERYSSERKWLIAQVQDGTMTKTFEPYLGFANIKV